jgi:hypothetical protein
MTLSVLEILCIIVATAIFSLIFGAIGIWKLVGWFESKGGSNESTNN